MKIPETDSIRELAAFWDTHDVTDFADELVEVAEPVFARRRTNRLTLERWPTHASPLEDERRAVNDAAGELPEPADREVKEVYAFYGLAAYMAQVVEKALVSLLSLVETEGLRITRADYNTIFSRMDSRTLGQLVRRLAQGLRIPPAAAAILMEALERRNYLAHQFFADRAAAFTLDEGRRQMIEELRAITALFHRAEAQIHLLSGPVMKRRGLTPEAVERAGQALISEFLAHAGEASSE